LGELTGLPNIFFCSFRVPPTLGFNQHFNKRRRKP